MLVCMLVILVPKTLETQNFTVYSYEGSSQDARVRLCGVSCNLQPIEDPAGKDEAWTSITIDVCADFVCVSG